MRRLILLISILFLMLCFGSVKSTTVTLRESCSSCTYNDIVNDTAFTQGGTDNYPTLKSNPIGATGSTKIKVMIKFTGLYNIPSNAIVSSAMLNFSAGSEDGWAHYCYEDSYQPTTEIHEVLRDWFEEYPNGANFNDSSGNWNTDILATHISLCNSTHDDIIPVSFDSPSFTDLVQSIINGTKSNYGWYIKADSFTETRSGNNITNVAMSEATSETVRPLLTIVYEEPVTTTVTTTSTTTTSTTTTSTTTLPFGSCDLCCVGHQWDYGECLDSPTCFGLNGSLDDCAEPYCEVDYCCCLMTTTTTTPITTTIEITTTTSSTTTYPPFMNITNFPSCCIVSRTYCIDNETIRQIWVVNNQTVQADAFCPNGCDTVLNECRQPAMTEYIYYFLILAAIVIIIGIIIILYRRV